MLSPKKVRVWPVASLHEPCKGSEKDFTSFAWRIQSENVLFLAQLWWEQQQSALWVQSVCRWNHNDGCCMILCAPVLLRGWWRHGCRCLTVSVRKAKMVVGRGWVGPGPFYGCSKPSGCLAGDPPFGGTSLVSNTVCKACDVRRFLHIPAAVLSRTFCLPVWYYIYIYKNREIPLQVRCGPEGG